MNENNTSFFVINPYKNWLTIVLSVLFIILGLFFVFLYSIFIFFEKMYFTVPFVLLTLFILIILSRNLLWIIFGKIEIQITSIELSITKKNFSSSKSNYYYLEEIEFVDIKNLYFIQSIDKVPLFGGIFLSLINFSKKDSESIVIKYRNREIEIINHLTVGQAESVVESIKNFLNRKN